ncbi:hypothetical protein [Thermocrinis sp.]|jgi:hypothetical protein|uniref:hypothetical protein n=1 Tax=Thermocrinis sp. TaxID=2024383 RepID=UPI003C07ABE3
MKKGYKALKYADLVWDKKVRRITLEDLCTNWAFADLCNKGEITIGMRVHSYREKFKLSQTKQTTLFYAFLVFDSWAKTTQKHLKTKTLHKLLFYLIAYTLIPKLHFCTCKELLSFFKYDLPRLKARHRKNPRPLHAYQRLSDPQAVEKIHQALKGLQDPKNVQFLSKLLGIPLRNPNPPSS